MILYLGNKLSVHGFTPTSVETLGGKIAVLDFPVITKSAYNNKFMRLIDMLYAIIKYRHFKPVLLIDTYSTSAFWFAYASAKIALCFKLNYIPVLRGGDLPARLNKSRKATQFIFNNSFSNVAVSDYLQREFQTRNLPVQLIHNYLELEKYTFTHRKEIHPNILWVRSFHEIYNPEMALHVLKIISKVYPLATLCMVGPEKDGSLENCRKLAGELNLNVFFPGRLSKEEWTILSRNYDIFINTTNVDNTPISVMEAMALGMPVVTTNAGGIPFLFKDGNEGLMVNKNNAEEMAVAIMSLIENPTKCSHISFSARQKAEEWDWKLIGPQWKILLNRALNSEQL